MNKNKILTIIIIILAVIAVGLSAFFGFKAVFGNGGKSGTSSTQSTNEAKGGTAEFVVESVEGKADSIVEVPIKVTENDGFHTAILNVEFDDKKLEYKGFVETELFSDTMDYSKGNKVNLSLLSQKDVADAGDVVVLKFKIKAKQTGEAEIKLTVDKTMITNLNEQMLDAKTKNGKITIK